MRQPRQRQFNEDRVTLYSQKVPGPYWQVLVMLLMLMACCSLKPFFFFTLLAKTTAVEEQTTKQGAVFLQYHTAVSQERLFLLLGRLLMRRDYRPIIITQINHHNITMLHDSSWNLLRVTLFCRIILYCRMWPLIFSLLLMITFFVL